MKSSRILITGGNGFIGKNLTLYLIKKGYDVHILSPRKIELETVSYKNIHIADILNREKIAKILFLTKPEYIIHLASYGNYPEEQDLDKMISVNIIGLSNLIASSDSLRYKKMIIAGSSSEYGFKNKSMKEEDLLVPNSYYSATKGSATLIAQAYAKANKKPIVILRFFSVYGPYEKKSRFIPTVINANLKGEQINLTPGKIKRDFIYVDDVVSSIEKSFFVKLVPGEIINIGTGKDFSNDYIVKIIGRFTDKKIKINKGKFKPRIWDSGTWKADIRKAQKLLNWKPVHSLEEGLRLTYDWWKNEKH